MELWSLDHTGGFIIVIWRFTTADCDSFCPSWYVFCWAQKFNLCLSLSWLYLDFRAGMEEVAQPQSLELGQAAHWTASASTSLCTQGVGVWSWNVARMLICTKERGCISVSQGLDIARVCLWEDDLRLYSHLLCVCPMTVPSQPALQWVSLHRVPARNYLTWNRVKQKLNES